MAPEPVDFGNCDREPMHTPACIRPHGCLLASTAMVALRQSESLPAMLGLTEAINGQPIEALPGGPVVRSPRNALTQPPGRAAGDDAGARGGRRSLRRVLIERIREIDAGRDIAGATRAARAWTGVGGRVDHRRPIAIYRGGAGELVSPMSEAGQCPNP